MGPSVMGMLAAVAYALILPPILRLWKRPAPRWLLAPLVPMCFLLGGLWITSQFVAIAYSGINSYLSLYGGTVSLKILERPTFNGAGWSFGNPSWPLMYENYFSWRSGRILVDVPLGALLWLLLVPTLALALRARHLDPKRCKRCEYDLTGNVSGVCPECGTAVERSESPPIESRA